MLNYTRHKRTLYSDQYSAEYTVLVKDEEEPQSMLAAIHPCPKELTL